MCPADSCGHVSLDLTGEMQSVALDLIKAMGLDKNIQEEFIERGESWDAIAQDTNIKERYKRDFARRLWICIRMEGSGASKATGGDRPKGSDEMPQRGQMRSPLKLPF